MHVFLHRTEMDSATKESRTVSKRRRPGISSGYYMNVVNGYFQERIEPKETPSCLISRQLEILATNAAKQCINFTVQKLTNVNH